MHYVTQNTNTTNGCELHFFISRRPTSMRKSDISEKTHYRFPDRVFRRERQWYFRTREGDRAPFPTRAAANLVRDHFVDTMEHLDENKHALPSDVDSGDVTMVDIGKPNRFTR